VIPVLGARQRFAYFLVEHVADYFFAYYALSHDSVLELPAGSGRMGE
jgi:hypothetical protein